MIECGAAGADDVEGARRRPEHAAHPHMQMAEEHQSARQRCEGLPERRRVDQPVAKLRESNDANRPAGDG